MIIVRIFPLHGMTVISYLSQSSKASQRSALMLEGVNLAHFGMPIVTLQPEEISMLLKVMKHIHEHVSDESLCICGCAA